MEKILFVDCDDSLAEGWARVLRPDDPPIAVNRSAFARDALPEIVAGYPICIDDHSYFTAPVLERCRDLKHIVFLGTGAASYIDLAAAAKRGIGVSTIKGYGDTAVAEHAITLMMAACREVAVMDREIRGGTWRPRQGVQLAGKTLGLLGLGGIGGEVARIAAGIGMRVIAWNRTPRERPGVTMAPLETVLGQSDIVSLHLTLNEETRGFLGAERLARMKPGAILVNTARGAVLDEAALVAALQAGRLRHAALDVFAEEPLPPSHPLAQLANVTLSAHAGFGTPDALDILLRRAIDLATAAAKELP
jgi:D-3-phosphoglycerate dehydrogenase / 2-oxoglutarate reductase